MPELAPASPFWAPHVHADRRPVLMARARIVAALRAWFTAHDFVEVETAALQVSPGNETHLHAFATMLESPDGASARLYLRTSPEFACKKLLAAGERRIVEFAKAFRNRERGALHHPEFTLVEWYRAGEPYEALMADCAASWRSRRPLPGQASHLSRPRGRCVRRAGAAYGRRGIRTVRRP
jgi:lysyl-tRNA synthetase class 2